MKEKLIAILKEKIEMYQNDIDHYINYPPTKDLRVCD